MVARKNQPVDTAQTVDVADQSVQAPKKSMKKVAPKKATNKGKAPARGKKAALKKQPAKKASRAKPSKKSAQDSAPSTSTEQTTQDTTTPAVAPQPSKRRPANRKTKGKGKKAVKPKKAISKRGKQAKKVQTPQTPQTNEDGTAVVAQPSQAKSRRRKVKKNKKMKIHVPRGIYDILESVKKYEERIRQLPDSDFALLNDCYISSYTIHVDKKTWFAEKVSAKRTPKDELKAKPNFLTDIKTMDELMGHALHYNDVNSAIIDALRMQALIKVAAEKGCNILGVVGEKQSQQQKLGPKFWKLDCSNGRSQVVTHLEDGRVVVDRLNPTTGNTERTIDGVVVDSKKPFPLMNWNNAGSKVVYVGGIQRFPIDRPLFSSKFALKSSDFAKYKPEEYKRLVDLDLHFQDIPKASDYFNPPATPTPAVPSTSAPVDVPAATA